jgi:hypothetical protein
MARIEAPAGAKAAGNSYSPEPVVTAPVVDSTFDELMHKWREGGWMPY